jgi:hypothetical protein
VPSSNELSAIRKPVVALLAAAVVKNHPTTEGVEAEGVKLMLVGLVIEFPLAAPNGSSTRVASLYAVNSVQPA